jgi:hypothetical protein
MDIFITRRRHSFIINILSSPWAHSYLIPQQTFQLEITMGLVVASGMRVQVVEAFPDPLHHLMKKNAGSFKATG